MHKDHIFRFPWVAYIYIYRFDYIFHLYFSIQFNWRVKAKGYKFMMIQISHSLIKIMMTQISQSLINTHFYPTRPIMNSIIQNKIQYYKVQCFSSHEVHKKLTYWWFVLINSPRNENLNSLFRIKFFNLFLYSS